MNTILLIQILVYTLAIFAAGYFSAWYMTRKTRQTFMTDVEDIMRGYYPVADRAPADVIPDDVPVNSPPKRPPAQGPKPKPPLPNEKTWLDS